MKEYKYSTIEDVSRQEANENNFSWKYYDEVEIHERRRPGKVSGNQNAIRVRYLLCGVPVSGRYHVKKGRRLIAELLFYNGYKIAEKRFGANRQLRELFEWNEQGLPERELHFDAKGLLTGTARKWHSNGSLKESADYADGLLDGKYKLFAPNGVCLISTHYEKGLLQKGTTFSDESDKQKEALHWQDGRLDGYARRIVETGRPLWIEQYEDGKLRMVDISGKNINYPADPTIKTFDYRKIQR